MSYTQVRYLCDQGIIQTPATRQGKDRQLNDNDLNIIELVAALRSKKIGYRRIHPAVIASLHENQKVPFLYIQEGLRPFVILWDGQKWDAETSTQGMSKLYQRANEMKAIVFGKWDERIKKMTEVHDERPTP